MLGGLGLGIVGAKSQCLGLHPLKVPPAPIFLAFHFPSRSKLKTEKPRTGRAEAEGHGFLTLT